MAKKKDQPSMNGNGAAPAGETAPARPKRVMSERLKVLRVADKIATLDADGKAGLLGTLNATDVNFQALAKRHKLVAKILGMCSHLTPDGIELLKRLAS